jgi:hypothetical protein
MVIISHPASIRSSMVSSISSLVSPSPSIIPDLDLIPADDIFYYPVRLTSYLALLLITGVRRLTVSRLWEITSGRASMLSILKEFHLR